ncbi:hypothetical protein RF11_02442 [Thelohanellus kitauei]|uniref:Uncharacterized protein n=1 Tax=Thelohanellus kitauei TaxID=669202 RepID=A0A0C2ILD7_THEKT|nr:hypothetical protein RF11_02442 [Thelohanellus kitauei]
MENLKTQIGELILPAGSREDYVFLMFVTSRGIVLAMVVSIIPPDWNISDVIIFLILGANIILVLVRKPYQGQVINENESGELDLDSSNDISGETLEVTSIFLILTSVFLLDSKSEFIKLSTKSVFVGVLNLSYTLYLLFGVILKRRINFGGFCDKILVRSK